MNFHELSTPLTLKLMVVMLDLLSLYIINVKYNTFKLMLVKLVITGTQIGFKEVDPIK